MTLKRELADDILPDSTAWIDYFNPEIQSPCKRYLELLIENGHNIWICPVVFQEVLQGARGDKMLNRCRHALQKCYRGRIGAYQAAEYGADIYRTLRKKGFTIRKPNDCLIAAYAMLNDLALLHNDRDFDPMEQHLGLKVVH
jgi:predicted nucleic acid-binding protein